MVSPVAAPAKTITAGVVPGGTSKPSVNSEDPAAAKAPARSCSNGQSSSVNPAKAVPSQAASCATRIAAAWKDITRSRRR